MGGPPAGLALECRSHYLVWSLVSKSRAIMNDLGFRLRIILTVLFAVCMAYFEASVVVYLRELIYPEGFSLPLRIIPDDILRVEIAREAASLIMILSVAALAGRRLWERCGYFLIIFGVWDIFYYVWLYVTLGWPASLSTWDILFLIPRPWIGPVIAPVLIALSLVVMGFLIVRLFDKGYDFKPTWIGGGLFVAGSCVILYSFMHDTNATYNLEEPQPYMYWLLAIGLVMYAVAFWHAWRRVVKRF